MIEEFNALVGDDGKHVTIPIKLPMDHFDLLRDSILFQSISGVSSTVNGDAGGQEAQASSISDVISGLISGNLPTQEECHPRPIAKPPSGAD